MYVFPSPLYKQKHMLNNLEKCAQQIFLQFFFQSFYSLFSFKIFIKVYFLFSLFTACQTDVNKFGFLKTKRVGMLLAAAIYYSKRSFKKKLVFRFESICLYLYVCMYSMILYKEGFYVVFVVFIVVVCFNLFAKNWIF